MVMWFLNTFSTPFHQCLCLSSFAKASCLAFCSIPQKSAFAKLFSYTPNIFISLSMSHTHTHFLYQLTEPLPLLIFGDAFERLGTSSQLLPRLIWIVNPKPPPYIYMTAMTKKLSLLFLLMYKSFYIFFSPPLCVYKLSPCNAQPRCKWIACEKRAFCQPRA